MRYARLMAGQQMTNEEWMEFMRQSIASHDRQIGELTESIAKHDRQIGEVTAAVAKLVEVSNQDATSIRSLADRGRSRSADAGS